MEFISLDVCLDCMLVTANGETDPDTMDDTSWSEPYEAFCDAYHLMFDGEELGFSWSSCDVCNRYLGGDRYRLFAEERSPAEHY